MNNWREEAAKFYDLSPTTPDDIGFYRSRVPVGGAETLELGCGTGRVSVSLALKSSRFLGIDSSPAMADRCRRRLEEAGLDPTISVVEIADIASLSGENSFDFIVAPFRVMQNLETDEQVQGLLTSIRRNLKPDGRAILNVFNPSAVPDEMVATASQSAESLSWEVETETGRVMCYVRIRDAQLEPLIMYPDLIYRRVVDEEVVEEVILSIAMRCYYPNEFRKLIEEAGFSILESWGGYAGEPYGEGPELVVEFAA